MEQENVRALGIMGETVFTQNFHRAKEMKASIETGSVHTPFQEPATRK